MIAAAYYVRVMRVIWMDDVPDGDITPIRTPAPIVAALVITAVGTIVLGVLPNLVARFGNLPGPHRARLRPESGPRRPVCSRRCLQRHRCPTATSPSRAFASDESDPDCVMKNSDGSPRTCSGEVRRT